jgi:hypothetical protein
VGSHFKIRLAGSAAFSVGQASEKEMPCGSPAELTVSALPRQRQSVVKFVKSLEIPMIYCKKTNSVIAGEAKAPGVA